MINSGSGKYIYIYFFWILIFVINYYYCTLELELELPYSTLGTYSKVPSVCSRRHLEKVWSPAKARNPLR